MMMTRKEHRNASCWRQWCFLYLLVSLSVTICSCLVPPIVHIARIPLSVHARRQVTFSCAAKAAFQQEEFEDDEDDEEEFDFEEEDDDDDFEEEEDDDDDDEDEVDYGKFEIATGMQDGSDDIPPLADFLNDDDTESTRLVGSSSSQQQRQDQNKALDETQRRIEEQQRQIDLLMEMVQKSTQTTTTASSSTASLPPLPPREEEMQDYYTPVQQHHQQQGSVMAPLKAMLFIDGTWLYYSIHGRRERDCPIVRKFGRGWQHRYRIDWTALPRMVCEQLQKQQADLGWGNEERPMEIVRASVYTSMKNDTSPQSFRVRMFEEMGSANFDVHCMTTVGEGEKCVDIQLAVEMLHYATVPNAYDVAILLSGDKDFLPALVRTRQKGRKVGIVSMRAGCNRALYESPNVKDYNVVWIEDFLDQLIVPLSQSQQFPDSMTVSRFTLIKVLYDFMEKSGLARVSSRDIGKYLKLVKIGGGSLLEKIKQGYGGLYFFLNQGECFDVERRKDRRKDPNDKSFWVSLHLDSAQLLLDEAKRTHFSKEEKEFFDTYSLEILDTSPKSHVYFHSLHPDKMCPPEYNYWEVQHMDDEEEEEELPAELTKDFSQCTVVQLKDHCRARGLPVSGTKAILLERVQTDLESQISELRELQRQRIDKRRRSNVDGSSGASYPSVNPAVTQHLEHLIREYLQANGGQASSRDVGRYLSANAASQQSRHVSALSELKDEYGSLGSFFSRSDGFDTQSTGDSSKFEFMVSPRGSGSDNTTKESVDPAVTRHLEGLVREYLQASGGHASSRDVGRYLAANAASQQSGHRSALTELKEEYGSLSSFIGRSNAFGSQSDAEKRFRITLREPATS